MTDMQKTPQIFYGILKLYWETGDEPCSWALEEDGELLAHRVPGTTDPYEALHVIDPGDTLIVGVPKNIFHNWNTQDILNIAAYDKSGGGLPAPMKAWTAVYADIAYDFDINKTDLADHGLHGVVQRINGATVNGLAKGIAPENWFAAFNDNLPAILIKGGTKTAAPHVV